MTKILTKEQLRQKYKHLKKIEKFNTDNEIIEFLIEEIENDYVLSEFNGIYVYMGTYKEDLDELNTMIKTDKNASYKKFYELDSKLPKCIKVGDSLEEFEHNNIIMTIPNARNYESESTFEQDFDKLRKIYLKTLCISGEDAAVDLVTSKEYIAEVFSVKNYMRENNIGQVFYQSFFDAALCNQREKVLKKTK